MSLIELIQFIELELSDWFGCNWLTQINLFYYFWFLASKWKPEIKQAWNELSSEWRMKNEINEIHQSKKDEFRFPIRNEN